MILVAPSMLVPLTLDGSLPEMGLGQWGNGGPSKLVAFLLRHKGNPQENPQTHMEAAALLIPMWALHVFWILLRGRLPFGWFPWEKKQPIKQVAPNFETTPCWNQNHSHFPTYVNVDRETMQCYGKFQSGNLPITPKSQGFPAELPVACFSETNGSQI